MSGKFVRASKYRHVFGQAAKKELCYENLKVTKNAWDSNIINCNGKYLAVTWEASGGGAFAVIPVAEVGKAPDTVSLFRGHKGPVLDTAFSPFDKQQVASCSDDGRILVWRIPEDYSFRNYRDSEDNVKDIVEPVTALVGHTRKVGHIEYHPCAANVLASASMDYSVKIWNVETGTAERTLQHKDLVTWFAFNYNGSLMATTSRDKKLRVWDLRTGECVAEAPGHTGAKASRVVWLGNTDRICTTGFSRLSDRQVGIWDVSALSSGPIDGFMVVDSSSGVLIPVFDDASSILYLAGKGDGNIRYYEYDNDVLHEISQYASTDAQRGFAAAPKTCVNMRENEILRSYKTVHDSAIEPISFIVPRKSDLFQSDIYPDAPSDQPALSAADWFGGKSVNGPLLVSMEAIYDGAAPEVKSSSPSVSISERKAEKVEKEVAAKSATPVPSSEKSAASSPAPSATSAPAPSTDSARSTDSVDDVLKSSGKVDSLLSKVVDESDDEDSKRVGVSQDHDDEWEEVKKPVERAPAKAKSEVKTEPKIEANVEPKTEPKTEPKVEPKKEAEAKESTPASVTESESPAPSSASASAKPAASGSPTLRQTVDKLASLVAALEQQVSTLAAANIDKNDKIESLEKKIDELLKK